MVVGIDHSVKPCDVASVDANGRRRSGKDVIASFDSDAKGAAQLMTWVDLAVPPDVLPGRYTIQTGTYLYGDLRRQPMKTESGVTLGDSATLATARIAPAPPAQMPARRVEATLAGGPKLIGYDVVAGRVSARVTLFWQATSRLTADYTVFVHVADAAGRPIAQHTVPRLKAHLPPRTGRRATSCLTSTTLL